VPESQTPAPPPLGQPIAPGQPAQDDSGAPVAGQPTEGDQGGENVVVTPFTAGSAGGAHTQQES